ncbi:MAG: PAS domain S-box protein, partial [Mariprofundaceae bacterium]
HPDPDMEFGFEHGKRHRAQDVYPELTVLFEKDTQIEDEWVNDQSPLTSDSMVYIAKIHFDADRSERYLGLAMVASYQSFIADTEAVRDQSMALIMVLVVVATALAYFFSRILIRPLNRMAEAARNGASEMLAAALPVKRSDEIGVLARSFQAMLQHIDERNAAFKKSEQRVRLLLDSTGEAMCGVDLDGICTFCNRAAIELLGYQSKNDILSKNLHALIHHTRADGNIYPVEDCRISQAFREGRAIHADDEVFWRADGSSFPIIYRSYPVRRDNEVVGAVVTFVDITDLRQALAEKARLASAVEQAVEGVCIMDHKRIINYVNPAFERLTGYDKEELIGKNISILRNQRHDEEFYQRMWDTLYKGGAWQGRITMTRKDSRAIELERSITPIRDDDGRIVSFVSVHRDISQEQMMQSRLEHAQRLESLGVLAGGIAHDFNNLLTAIIGNASLASKKLGPLAPVHEEILYIEDAAGSAADLCRQLLAYGGKGKFVIAPVNLSNLVREISKLLEVSVGKSVKVKYDLPLDLPVIDADAAQMKQVIMNLIINASEAIGGGEGDIFIRTGLMQVDQMFLAHAVIGEQLPEAEYVFLEVHDSGCGMDDATMTKVFDPFFTTKVDGRGLGMSAVLGIVRGHQGAIRVVSKPGQGSVFTMVLPPSEETALPPSDGEEECGDWRGSGTILVVDDEDRVRKVAGMMLDALGFDVLFAEDGEQAVAVFQREHEHIDAVLLDMTMPKMNGEQAFREMRRIQADACIILSSGFNKPDAKGAFTTQGLAGFMQKPYSINALRNKLREILEGGEAGA